MNAPTAALPTRVERVRAIARLREGGASQEQIAERLGISRSYVYDLLLDPTGVRSKTRRERYRGTCVDCGARTCGSEGRAKAPKRCVPCSRDASRRWTEERVIAVLIAWSEEHGRPPTATEWMRAAADRPSTNTVAAYFGTWNKAVQAAGLTPMPACHHLGDWRGSKDEVIELLQDWAAERGRPPAKQDWARADNGRPGSATVAQLFGSWSAALAAAGLPRRRGGRGVRLTDEQLIDQLQAWAAEQGCSPTAKDWEHASDGRPSAATVMRRFGGWRRALEIAGLPARAASPRWESAEMLDLLRGWAAEHGRSPRVRDWERAERGRPCADTVKERFETWSKALVAAGLPPNRRGGSSRKWTDERLLAAVQTTAREKGRRPFVTDWRFAAGDHPSSLTVYHRFGSWGRFLEAAGLADREER